MLRIFSRIRLSLIGSSTGRYILYAIGEIALVVIGILIALQINNWNEERKRHLEEQEFLSRLKNDLEYDMSEFQGDIKYLELVYAAGSMAFTYLNEAKSCRGSCTQILVSFYNATQWTPLSPRETTFNEFSQTGFPSNRELKNKVTTYHSNFAILEAIGRPSEYREHIRSFLSPELQRLLWETCHPSKTFSDTRILIDCDPEVSDEKSMEILNAIASDTRTKSYLNFWMGTVFSMIETTKINLTEAKNMIDMIDEELGNFSK